MDIMPDCLHYFIVNTIVVLAVVPMRPVPVCFHHDLFVCMPSLEAQLAPGGTTGRHSMQRTQHNKGTNTLHSIAACRGSSLKLPPLKVRRLLGSPVRHANASLQQVLQQCLKRTGGFAQFKSYG